MDLILSAYAACKSEISGAAADLLVWKLARMEKAMNTKSNCEPHQTVPAAVAIVMLVVAALLHMLFGTPA